MSNTNCNFDYKSCPEKTQRFSRWAGFCSKNPALQTNPDAFEECPNTKCPRYRNVVSERIIPYGHEQR